MSVGGKGWTEVQYLYMVHPNHWTIGYREWTKVRNSNTRTLSLRSFDWLAATLVSNVPFDLQLEVMHGVLNDSRDLKDRSFFYLRDPLDRDSCPEGVFKVGMQYNHSEWQCERVERSKSHKDLSSHSYCDKWLSYVERQINCVIMHHYALVLM